MQNEIPTGDGAPAAKHDALERPLPSPERIQELLHDAARIGRADVIPALLLAGADIEARDSKGYTPLILAAYNGHDAAAALLLHHGARPDTPDLVRGNTALMGVAFKGYDSIAGQLLAARAQPDAINKAGQTALMMAAMFGHAAIVDRLLAAGADPRAIDAAGNSASSIARGQGNDLMVAKVAAPAGLPG
jgi:ankyrin repeat protein